MASTWHGSQSCWCEVAHRRTRVAISPGTAGDPRKFIAVDMSEDFACCFAFDGHDEPRHKTLPVIAYCPMKIDFGIMPWMPLVPSTTCVTW